MNSHNFITIAWIYFTFETQIVISLICIDYDAVVYSFESTGNIKQISQYLCQVWPEMYRTFSVFKFKTTNRPVFHQLMYNIKTMNK